MRLALVEIEAYEDKTASKQSNSYHAGIYDQAVTTAEIVRDVLKGCE